MIAAIHQPNYLPWLGYFNKMAKSDVFVILDDVQFSVQSWQQRNKIKYINESWMWLSVPVIRNFGQNINDVRINDASNWRKKHWRTIQLSYKKARFFDRYEAEFSRIYDNSWEKLRELNVALIRLIRDLLGIKTTLVLSSDMNIEARGTEKLISVIRELTADKYITGEGGGFERYISEEEFKENSIELIYQHFQHPVYHQLWGEFVPNLSVIDLLFNEGEKSLGILMGASS